MWSWHADQSYANEITGRSGRPDAAIDVQMGSSSLDLLDDPTSGPEGLRRRTDDEGAPVLRRWLLRRGVVSQPLADRRWVRRSDRLSSGAARRQSRHLGPVPRSLHLELLPGTASTAELAGQVTGPGLYAAEASQGSLDPLTGEFSLTIAHGRRIDGGEIGDRVGRFVVRGQVSEALGRVVGIGSRAVVAGAGWCAKGGQRLPVSPLASVSGSTSPRVQIEASSGSA